MWEGKTLFLTKIQEAITLKTYFKDFFWGGSFCLSLPPTKRYSCISHQTTSKVK